MALSENGNEILIYINDGATVSFYRRTLLHVVRTGTIIRELNARL
jgi:hypothetical protein